MFTIGADPELFVGRIGEEGFFPAEGLVKGTKEEPQKVPFGAVQVDGMALEFNIDPASTREEFVRNVNEVRRQLAGMIGPELELRTVPVAFFTEEQWEKVSLESAALGCDPDFNAWTAQQNMMPDNGVFFRTAAGHIHVGWDVGQPDPDEHYYDCCGIVRHLDCLVGAWSVLNDDDTRRRTLYGGAGAFRPKPYGLEYRTPSNFWLKTEELTAEAFDLTHKAMSDWSNDIRYENYVPTDLNIMEAINSSDKDACNFLFETMRGL